MKQNQYKDAKKTLKLCLECSWIEDSLEAEMLVYEKLALCHFYEGELEDSEFYIIRYLTGITEPHNSETRAVYKNIRKNYTL